MSHGFQVIELRETENPSHDYFLFMMGPSLGVRCYNGCIVGVVRFHMSERDSRCTTQNSKVMVIGESNASERDDNNLYDVLNEVLHVPYLMGRSVWLVKCLETESDNYTNCN